MLSHASWIVESSNWQITPSNRELRAKNTWFRFQMPIKCQFKKLMKGGIPSVVGQSLIHDNSHLFGYYICIINIALKKPKSWQGLFTISGIIGVTGSWKDSHISVPHCSIICAALYQHFANTGLLICFNCEQKLDNVENYLQNQLQQFYYPCMSTFFSVSEPPLLLRSEVCFSTLELGLGHVHCFGQYNSTRDKSRGLKSAYTSEFTLLSLLESWDHTLQELKPSSWRHPSYQPAHRQIWVRLCDPPALIKLPANCSHCKLLQVSPTADAKSSPSRSKTQPKFLTHRTVSKWISVLSP